MIREDQLTAQLLKGLWFNINSRRRRQFLLLGVLMVLSSFAEIVSIGTVLPFLAILTKPDIVFDSVAAQPIIQFLGITAINQLLLPFTIAFIIAILIAGIMRLLLLWTSTKLSFAIGADISINIYRRTLYQSYSVHCARNSSELINSISTKTSITTNIINMLILLVCSGVILSGILTTLILINPFIAFSIFGGFGLIYIFIVRLARNRLLSNSKITARESTQVIKSLQEGLGGIRDVLIDGSQATYCEIYQNADLPLRRAQANSSFISASPRYIMEVLGMILISTLAFHLTQKPEGSNYIIPVLGVLALGAQRLLPILQQIYAAWTYIKSNQVSLQDVLDLLNQPLPDYANKPVARPLPFKSFISLKQVCFRYNSETPYILKHLNLNIAKGSRIGFIGATGAGKSTLLDIIMGLLHPSEGILKIDGVAITLENHRAWQSHIAHVPQTIFLTDSSIEENIAFGIPKEKINFKRVREAAQQAQIAESIESWPNQYKTFIGERGIRLSGGQRQRIGIARALYKEADVIIFDEATSALDNETEQAVMEAIENLSKDLTLLIIAHRLTTLKNCTQIVELNSGEIKRSGNYYNIVNQ